MKALPLIHPETVFIEIEQSTLKALNGDAGLEVPLERLENGRLTHPCRERLTEALTAFVKPKSCRPHVRAYCAVGARGVSLRCLSLPPSPKEELRRVLWLQVESEFPLPPDELGWGYRLLNGPDQPPGGAPAKQQVLVVAAKKEVLAEYSEILAACGIDPVFTLAAVARSQLCPRPSGAFSVLEIGSNHSELASFEEGAPVSVRILAWGSENLTRALEARLGITRLEAQTLRGRLDQQPFPDGEAGQKIQAAIEVALSSLAACLNVKHT